MEALPQLMFKADAVIHIIGTPTKLMMGEGVPWQYAMKLNDWAERWEKNLDVCCKSCRWLGSKGLFMFSCGWFCWWHWQALSQHFNVSLPARRSGILHLRRSTSLPSRTASSDFKTGFSKTHLRWVRWNMFPTKMGQQKWQKSRRFRRLKLQVSWFSLSSFLTGDPGKLQIAADRHCSSGARLQLWLQHFLCSSFHH